MQNEYEAALSAEAEGTLHSWVLEYLSDETRGNNPSLAEILSRHGPKFIKLIEYPVDAFKVKLGPDRSFLYYEEPATYSKRVKAMVESLKSGWKPSPLIATNLWEDDFGISDGSHRVAALRQYGIKSYPIIIYFKDKKSFDQFTEDRIKR